SSPNIIERKNDGRKGGNTLWNIPSCWLKHFAEKCGHRRYPNKSKETTISGTIIRCNPITCVIDRSPDHTNSQKFEGRYWTRYETRLRRLTTRDDGCIWRDPDTFHHDLCA